MIVKWLGKCSSYNLWILIMYPSQSFEHTKQFDLTLETLMKNPQNFIMVKCETSLERFQEYYYSDEPKIMVYLVHHVDDGYTGD